MPYNTTAIPPRKEVTGQTQLPLSRVKKIIALDPDITVCSNNAAFAITLATELFIQYLSEEALHNARLERKPRRNIQYKDVSNAVLHQDNLEFLEDVVPRTTPYRQVKERAAATRAKLRGDKPAEDGDRPDGLVLPNGKKQKQKSTVNGLVNGSAGSAAGPSLAGGGNGALQAGDEDPSAQLEMEMRQARVHDGDVDMTGTD